MSLTAAHVYAFFAKPLRSQNEPHARSVGDLHAEWSQQHPKTYLAPAEIARVCRRLVELGYLIPAGQNRGAPPLCDAYFAHGKPDAASAEYGRYEFEVFGFKNVRDRFARTVLTMSVIKSDGAEDVGTAFLLDATVITAAHCMERMGRIQIEGVDPRNISAVVRAADPRVDLCAIRLQTHPMGRQAFRLGNSEILDEVMTMGFPPMSGFDTILVSETAQIAGYVNLKTSIGQIVGDDRSYLDGQRYLLVTARVKGGNSGGPVVNSAGDVVGVVVQLPLDGSTGLADHLGFASALPSSAVAEMLKGGSNAVAVPFQLTDDRKALTTR